MIRSRATLLFVIAATAMLLTGCNQLVTHRSIGIDPADIADVELYVYAWGENSKTVDRITIANDSGNGEIVEKLVDIFTGVPTTDLDDDVEERMPGAETLGVRYVLHDGTTVELTRILVERYDAILIWPDLTASHTEWGAPDALDYYSEFGTVEQVDASERPQAELPGQR